MPTVTISAARAELSTLVDSVSTEPVTVSRRGRPAAVIVSPEAYETMVQALEDVADVEAFDAAMAEEGANIPWDQVKADLGLS